VVIYKSPLPRTQLLGNTEIRDWGDFEELLLQGISREPGIGDQVSLEGGVFVRPLEEGAFEKHVEGLESY
jgi:hypothetical protein